MRTDLDIGAENPVTWAVTGFFITFFQVKPGRYPKPKTAFGGTWTKFISLARAHTIKKFELIKKYVETWAQKLLNTRACKGIVFIDCMCNSGIYHDENGETVYGTPIRVSRILRDVAGQ